MLPHEPFRQNVIAAGDGIDDVLMLRQNGLAGRLVLTLCMGEDRKLRPHLDGGVRQS